MEGDGRSSSSVYCRWIHPSLVQVLFLVSFDSPLVLVIGGKVIVELFKGVERSL